ncbi:MAG: hypothetical protein AAB655_02070 [Patescibacteria group bacterium]
MEVIPVINCLDLECAVEKIRLAKEFLKDGDWLHLDIADGKFTFNKTWNDPAGWQNMAKGFNLEAHLMVEEPEKHTEEWLHAGAKRLIIHVETINEKTLRQISALARKHGVELMLSSNPETPVDKLKPYLDEFKEFQVLAVYPGPPAQKFLPIALYKIEFLRRSVPDAKIEVDGGIDFDTAKTVKNVGADKIVSGTYIFGNADPKSAYEELISV